MLDNNYVTCLSLSGIVVLSLGTIMGIIGAATTDWFLFEADTLNDTIPFYSMNMNPVATGLAASDPISCRVGIWQLCCGHRADVSACVTYSRNTTDAYEALRILMVISLIILCISVVNLLCYSFKEKWNSCYGARLCVSAITGISLLLFLLTTISTTLVEYTNPEGFFGANLGTSVSATLGWSFIICLVGALVNPLGLFFLCTQWHFTDDKEAGVNYDYDEKRMIQNNNAVDTYI